MNEKDLIKFLKEHLKVEVSTKPIDDYYKGVVGYEITTKLILQGEVLDESTDSIDTK